ncbi:MAG: arginine--tRNA ligase [Nanohaloarchaea archaeon]|nr:arginine--tRNA ligase [Candidatus Nanohaloarchaea archaeon]
MYLYEACEKEINSLLEICGVKNARIEMPPKNIDADFSYPCFALSKTLNKKPDVIAKEFKEQIDKRIEDKGLVARCEVLGPYLNFYIDSEQIAEKVISGVQELKSTYGSIDEGKKKKIIVEYVSTNPIHPLHIGSARSAILGKSLTNTYSFLNYDVNSHYYMNDIGLQVAKVAFGYSKLKDKTITERPDVWIGKIYAITSAIMADDEDVKAELKDKWPDMYAKLDSALASEKDIEGQVKGMLQKIEAGDKKTATLFKKVGNLCTDGFKKTFERMNIEFDSYDYESMFVINGDVYKVIDALKDKKVIKKTDQGTWIIDLEKYKMPSTVLVRSDNTTLYLTRDIAYSIWKFEKAKAEKVINIIASEQELPQQQLKMALKILEKPYADNLYHLSYGLVHLPGIKMSGRRGRYITFDYVFDEAIKKAYEVVDEKNPDLSQKEKIAISEMVGKGAVIYSILKIEARKNVIFDMDDALDFNGNSAPYIQYTHARAKSIINRAGGVKKYDSSLLMTDSEQNVLKRLAKFPEILKSCSKNVSPHVICNYLFELAQDFNNFYNSMPVIKADEDIRNARLALVESAAQVIKNGLLLLEIEAPEKM